MYYIFVHFVITNHENEYMSNLKKYIHLRMEMVELEEC